MEPPPSEPTGGGDLLRAQQLLLVGRPADALRWADRAAQADPAWAAAQAVRAEALLQLERFDQAGEASQRALELAPEDPWACRVRALVLLRRGSPRECLRLARLACELQPESPASLYVRVQAELLNGLVIQAELTAARLRELAPLETWAHEAAGLVALHRSLWEQAAGQFRRALELEPELFSSLNNLAVCLERLGRLDEALDVLHRAARLAPEEPHVRLNLRRVISRRALRGVRPYLLLAGAWMAWLLITRRTGWLGLSLSAVERIDLAWLAVLAPLLAATLVRLVREQRRLHPELQAFEKGAERRAWPQLWMAAGACLLLFAGLALLDRQLRAWSLGPLTYVVCVALVYGLLSHARSALRASQRLGRPRWPPHIQVLLLAPLLTIWHKLIEPPQRRPLGFAGLLLLALPGLALLGLGLALKRRRRP